MTSARFTDLPEVQDRPQMASWTNLGAIPDTWTLTPCQNNQATNLQNVNFNQANLTRVVLAGLDLSSAHFTQTIFFESDLRFVCLRQSYLADSNFDHTWLDGSDLSGATLNNTSFVATQLNGVNFNGSSLLFTTFDMAEVGALTHEPCNELPRIEDCVEEMATPHCLCRPALKNTRLDYAYFVGTTINEADFRNASLLYSTFNPKVDHLPEEIGASCDIDNYQSCLLMKDCFIALSEGVSPEKLNRWEQSCKDDHEYHKKLNTYIQLFGQTTINNSGEFRFSSLLSQNADCLSSLAQSNSCTDPDLVNQCLTQDGRQTVVFEGSCDFSDIMTIETAEEDCNGPVPASCLLKATRISSSYFQSAFLNQSIFQESELIGNDFSHAELKHINLESSFLQDNYFDEALLNNSIFSKTKLVGTNSFIRTKFAEAHLTGVDWAQALLVGTDFNRANLTDSTFDYEEFILDQDPPSFRGANLQRAYFNNISWLYANFSESNLSNAAIENADLRNADFSFAEISFSLLGARSFSEEYSTMRLNGANFDYSNIDNVILSTFIQDASFEYASLHNVELCINDNSVTGIKCGDFSRTSFDHAFIDRMQKGVDTTSNARPIAFNGASFKNALIQNSDLSYANFSGANLKRASFIGSDLREITLSDSCLYDFSFTNTSLDNLSTIFDGSILKGVDFTGLDLKHVSFVGSDLRLSTFLYACNLNFASWTNANIQSATFCNTSVLYGQTVIGVASSRTCRDTPTCSCD